MFLHLMFSYSTVDEISRLWPNNTAKSRPNTNSHLFSINTKLTTFHLTFREFNDFANVFYTHTDKFVALNVNAYLV